VNLNYSFVAQRAEHRCEYCRAPEVVFNLAFEVDQIIPLSKNGRDEPKSRQGVGGREKFLTENKIKTTIEG